MLCRRFSEVDEISAATGIDVEELRRFAFGKTVPEGFYLDSLADHFRMVIRPRGVGPLLPIEEDAAQGIQELFRDYFSDAAEVLSLGLRVIGSTPKGKGKLPDITKPKGLGKHTVHLCLGIYAKILKHLRSVIALSELGLGEDAGIGTRALFEATMSLHFILQPKPLKEDGKAVSAAKASPAESCPKCKHIIKPAKSGLSLKRVGTGMRAKLYVAFACIQKERELDEYLRNGMHDTAAVLGDPDEIRRAAKKARKAIGSGWEKRQKDKKGYAGLSVRDLADSYGFLKYYLSIYRHQSHAVHGSDALLYFTSHEDGGDLKLNLGPAPTQIDTILFIGTTMTAGSIELLDKRLGLGFTSEIASTMKHLRDKSKTLQANWDNEGY